MKDLIGGRILANTSDVNIKIAMLNRQKMFTSNMRERMAISAEIKKLKPNL